MADSINGIAVYLVPGMEIKISSPVNGKNQQGFFVRTEQLPEGYWGTTDGNNNLALKRGFVVENTNVGSLREADEEEAAVIYTHRQPYPNAIWFFALTGERGLVKVISVPIHDHSTITTGGPAYGTYYDDDIERV